MSDEVVVTKAAAERAETLAVNEACNLILDTLYTRLGDRVLQVLADTEHVHSRAMVAAREGDVGGDANLDAILSGKVPATRVVLPVTITVRFGAVREVTSEELVRYMAAAKDNARAGKVPDAL